MLKRFVIVLTVLLLACGCLLAQAAPADTTKAKKPKGALDSFEDDLKPPSRDTTAADSSESSSGSIVGGIIGGFFKIVASTAVMIYLDLPHADYGPYPYNDEPDYGVFEADSVGSTPFYVRPGGGYKFTQPGIRTYLGSVSLVKNSLEMGAEYLHNRERLDSATVGTLDFLAITFGLTKAASQYAVWENHFGYRYIKGGDAYHGFLMGTELKFYTTARIAVTTSYDLNIAGHAGFHELDGSLSYFINRAELKAGYQWMKTFRGTALHGPHLGMTLWLTP